MIETDKAIKVLVVEDESIVALDMKNRLVSLGFEVCGIAATGPDAIEKARKNLPDIILMDIKLRGEMDGLHAADRIHQEQNVPIIFITAFADEKTLSRAKETEAYGYILKPFQEREVLISIEMALFKYRAEEELKNSRDWLNGSLNAISDAVVAVDNKGLVVFSNSSAARLFSKPEGLPAGISLSSLCSFHEDRFLEKLRLEHTGHASRGVWKLMESGNSSIPVELFSAPIAAPAGRMLQGTVYSIRDISEIVNSQRMRYRLSSVLSNSNDAIYAFDHELRIISWNSGAERLYGYTTDQILGESLEILLPVKDVRKEMLDLVSQSLADGAGQDGDSIVFESTRKKKNGRKISVASSLFVVPRPDNLEPELVLIERDVSAEKEYEASLIQARVLAEETSRAKSEFLSNMTHELRTPLNSIIGMVELAREHAHDSEVSGEELGEYLSIARHSAENLLFLINSILDYSRIEAGKMDVRSYQFDILDLVHDCLEGLSVQAWQKGLDLSFVFDSKLPSLVRGDPHRVRQIVINLLANAVKYTEHGHVSIKVSYSSSLEGVYYTIAVCDSGAGIPDDRVEHIWEKFTQLDGSSTRSAGGTGLGLAIVKSLVDMLGGSASVESEIGKGSCFTVRIPLELVEEGIPAAVLQEDLVDLCVVVAGGSERSLGIFHTLLDAWGVSSEFYPDAISFVDAMKALKKLPDLILVDDTIAERERIFDCCKDPYCRSMLNSRLVVLCSLGGKAEQSWRELCPGLHWLFKPPRRSDFLALLRASAKGFEEETALPVLSAPPVETITLDSEPSREDLAQAEATEQEGPFIDPDELEDCHAELSSDPKVLITLCTFMQNFSSPARRNVPLFEQEAKRCRKELEEARVKALPRRFFRLLLAIRRENQTDIDREFSFFEMLMSRAKTSLCKGGRSPQTLSGMLEQTRIEQ